MLPTITIDGKDYTVASAYLLSVDWKAVVCNLRNFSGLLLHQVATKSGVSYTRIQKISANGRCRLSDCEKISLLDLHQDKCKELHNSGILM